MFCAESTIHYSPGLAAPGKDKQHELALKERLNKTKEQIIAKSVNLIILRCSFRA